MGRYVRDSVFLRPRKGKTLATAENIFPPGNRRARIFRYSDPTNLIPDANPIGWRLAFSGLLSVSYVRCCQYFSLPSGNFPVSIDSEEIPEAQSFSQPDPD
jgi:hypothetical protein